VGPLGVFATSGVGDLTAVESMTTEFSLTTPRLRLRPWCDADRASFAAMSAHPDVMAYLTPMPVREMSDAWIDRQRAHQAAHGFCFWATELRETREFIGSVGLVRVRYSAHFTPAVEVGWRLAKRFWGRGYAPEAGAAALRFGFESLGLEEIVAVTTPSNTNSQRVMSKLGMTRDPADDFDHPLVAEGDPLRRHVLFRVRRDACVGRRGAVPSWPA
jgi:RimJ/RimL family protein N-acetyltransferase